ncbi:hypothetical protein Zmor_010756 [Zophobas morio]|uniref:Zinc finger PHD-type domain-containing protein n=1 Tax=Zophobas morio TaxID=2755281 RepID=A0AA38MK67_9CUCU|nr:hypothetical protein Zmor_010756 [Zophobas morio]
MSTCSLCNKKARSGDCVTCYICRKYRHTECAGLSRLEVECIRSSSRKIHYYCEKCDIVSIIHTMKTEIEVLQDELAELKKSGSNVADRDSEKKLSDEEIIAEIEDNA